MPSATNHASHRRSGLGSAPTKRIPRPLSRDVAFAGTRQTPLRRLLKLPPMRQSNERGHEMRPILAGACIALLWLAAAASGASANRFGPPWQSRVVVDHTVLYSQPDAGSPPVGPLARGEVVVVVGETTGTDSAAWTQVPDGFVLSADIAEDDTPWIAEVSVPSVSIYARPSLKEPIRRSAKQGDLLRVAGISGGIEGDAGIWWATTEGYVGLHTLRTATSDFSSGWTLPDGTNAAGGWW